MNRADAARIGGMDRQTLRDWVHRFGESSLPSRRQSPQSECVIGPTSVNPNNRWYYMAISNGLMAGRITLPSSASQYANRRES
jgi:hypothetical protein